MNQVFWKVWALLLILSIFWLGWCLKTSPSAQAQYGPADVRIVGITTSDPLSVDVKKVSGKSFGPLQVSVLRPALPVKVEK